MKKISILLSCLVLSLISCAGQRSVRVTGILTDKDREPVFGAAILVQGTTMGTITDFDGAYEIDVPVGSTLQFSCIGYETETVRVSNQNRIDIVMRDFRPRPDNAAAIAFIRNMYNNKLYEDYDFLRRHCTEDMLEELAEEFDYEGGGYATWLFRSGAQDDKYYSQPNLNVSKILSVTQVQEEWYEYRALDAGWEFTSMIRLIKSGNTFLIDSVDLMECEFEEDF